MVDHHTLLPRGWERQFAIKYQAGLSGSGSSSVAKDYFPTLGTIPIKFRTVLKGSMWIIG